MKMNTKFLGEVEVHEQQIIRFVEGIPGFPEEKEFVIIPLGAQSPFVTLQSLTSEGLGFMMATPYEFIDDYTFDLTKEDVNQLEIEQVEDVQVYGILTLMETLLDSTINLFAPVVINSKKRIAKQVILSLDYEQFIKYPLKKDKEV